MIVLRRSGLYFAVAVCIAALFPEGAKAQDLKSKLVVEIDRVESEIRDTRWNLNTLEEKHGLEKELDLLKKLYDRIVQHEGDIMTFECSGATLDPEGGPPRSTGESDLIGSLMQGSISTQAPQGNTGGELPNAGSGPALGYRFVYARQITDTEIRLLAQLVWIDDRLAHERWHLNNLSEKKELQTTRTRVLSALRRVRNSRC